MIPAALRPTGISTGNRYLACLKKLCFGWGGIGSLMLLNLLAVPAHSQYIPDTASFNQSLSPGLIHESTVPLVPDQSPAPSAGSHHLSFLPPPFDTLSPRIKKTRTWVVTGINVLGYGGVMTALAAAWYKDYTKSKLHSFNDSKEWLQLDKAGHLYGTWIESRANNEIWKWTGMARKKRIWISGLTSLAFQTTIEYLDGRSAEWGWSWADMGANILGSAGFIAQELAWDEQKIKLKWSFHRKKYSDPGLNQRSDDLFGKSAPERFLKDYNGQTYWASAPVKMILPKAKIPEWLCFSVGYGAEGMFGGTENIARDANGSILFDRRDIPRYRQWYLAPDIDWTKFKTKSRGLRFLVKVLSAFKFPAPALEWSNGRLKMHAVAF